MNANGLGHGAMTRSSTTSSETLPWLSGLTVSQAQTPRTSATILSSSTPSHEHHLMLPGAPSSALGGLYRPPLTVSELSRHPYQPVYTGTSGTTYPSALYTHAQPPGVSPLSPYGMYYQQHYGHPGFPGSASAGEMQQQSFSQLMARISQSHQLPRGPFHPNHPLYSGQPLTPPTGSPGPSAGPHQPIHPSPILPHSSMYRDHRDQREQRDRRRLPGGSSPDTKPVIHRQSPAQGGHYPELLPPSGPPRGEHHKESGSSYSGTKSGADSEYMRQHSGPHRRPAGSHMSSESYSGVKCEEPSSKRSKVGPPPPLHPSHPGPSGSSSSTSAPSLPPPPPLHSYPSHPHYPPHFTKGSIIQLANGELKRVEDLKTEDFINSADISADLKIDSSTVVRIKEDEDRNTAILSFSVGEQRIQVTVEATVEHPFFVFGRGWSSCCPPRTLRHYGLQCSLLSVGDVCISLTQKGLGFTSGPSTSGAPPSRVSSSVTFTSGDVAVSAREAGGHRSGQISGTEDTRLGVATVRWTGLGDQSGGSHPGRDSTQHPQHSQLLLHREGSHRRQHLPVDTVLPHRTTPPTLSASTIHGSSRPHQGPVPPGSGTRPGQVTRRRWSAPEQIVNPQTVSPGPEGSRDGRASPAGRLAPDSQRPERVASSGRQPSPGNAGNPATSPSSVQSSSGSQLPPRTADSHAHT